jgi:hypothetical protein
MEFSSRHIMEGEFEVGTTPWELSTMMAQKNVLDNVVERE